MTDSTNPRSGIDLQWRDESVRPQDDLFGHVNGLWLQQHQIPDDRSSDGAFRALYDQAEEDVRVIVEEASREEAGDKGKIAALYASFMDTDKVDALGLDPVRPLLDEVNNATDKRQLASLLGRYLREGLAALFAAYVSVDAKQPDRYLIYLTQSGLGLPDEAYYREDAHAGVRAAYVDYLVKVAETIGLADPKERAQEVMDLETELASHHWDRVANRDAEKTYNLFNFEELKEIAPSFDWQSWMEAIGATPEAFAEVVVRQPGFVESAATVWADRPLEQWKTWLQLKLVSRLAPYLHGDMVDLNFDFYGRTLSGTPELRPRWKRGISLVQGTLGEAIGQIYVERHFPPRAKEHMVELVDNLIAAYRESITALDWMSPATRERALEKLTQFTPKIGYPEKWKDYGALDVNGDDLTGNIRRAGEWSTDYDLAKLRGPVDRAEWLMTPQTVNAYYHPVLNEIVFPAAILQPPFFDSAADDAVNYGGIGAVIGHEVGHGFDDQGSRYDGTGRLTDWWEGADREEFQRRADALIAQYNELSPLGLPDNKVNGALTVGENIGDLGGLTIALKAYRISLGDTEAPVIDGLTGYQRVFFGWAQVWCTKTRDAEALRLLAIDPHSPANTRCNGVATNLDTFHEAFDVVEGDALFKPEPDRVRIW